jgi:signal transduction histidine kinase
MTTNSIGASSLPDDDGRQRNRPPPENESSIASLAHEINSPVEALYGLLYLIETKIPLAEKGHHYLALAREEIKRISQILHAAMDDFQSVQGPEGLGSNHTEFRSMRATARTGSFSPTRINCGKCSQTFC